MSPKHNDPAGELIGCLVCAAAVLILYWTVVLLIWTWPVWPWLVLSGFGWRLARRRTPKEVVSISGKKEEEEESFLRLAAESTLCYVTLGLGALVLTLIALNASHHLFDEDSVRKVESELVEIKLWIGEQSKSLPVFFGLLLVALLLSHVAPRLKAMAQLERLRTVATAVYVALVAITSFTLFAQSPIQDLLEKEAHRRNEEWSDAMIEYRAQLKREGEGARKYLAAQLVGRRLGALKVEQLGRLGRRIAAVSSGGKIKNMEVSASTLKIARARVIGALAREDWSLPVASMELARLAPESAPIARDSAREFHTPETLREWRELQRLPEDQQELNSAEQKAADEIEKKAAEEVEEVKVSAAKMITSQLFGAISPEFEGLVGAYVDAAIDGLVESAAGEAISSWFDGKRPKGSIGELSQRLASLSPKSTGKGLLPGENGKELQEPELDRTVVAEVQKELDNPTGHRGPYRRAPTLPSDAPPDLTDFLTHELTDKQLEKYLKEYRGIEPREYQSAPYYRRFGERGYEPPRPVSPMPEPVHPEAVHPIAW